MVDPLILVLFLFSGAAAGWIGFGLIPETLLQQTGDINELKYILTGITGLIGLIAGFIFKALRNRLVKQIRDTPTDLLISRAVGLILGLLLANLILAPILLLPVPSQIIWVKPLAAVLSNLFFGVIGYNLGEIQGRNLLRLFNPNSTEALLVTEGILTPATAKIIDTSVIIDGRIQSLLACGILEGQVIIAQTVIDELQQLADSSNNEKRGKGRRGLNLLTAMRSNYGRKLVVNSTKYEGKGTDDRLLKLTSDTGGTLITTDYNLAKVAEVNELKVLNLSELVIALRPNVQPGQELNLKIVREGKEESQGIGYLDDGTMVVVEGASSFVGTRKEVVITGELQTPTGRMIFGRLEKEPPNNKNYEQGSYNPR